MTHQTISFIKSGIRILGYVTLVPTVLGELHYYTGFLVIPAAILVVSELIGVIEEFGED